MNSPQHYSQPRVLVLGGVRERWSAHERQHDANYLNGIETWVFAFEGDYCWHQYATPELIRQYDLVICNTNDTHDAHYSAHYRRLAESRPSSVRWVSLLEGSMADYLKPTVHTRQIFDASNLVNCINRHATAMIQALTTTKVEYIGMPYPVEGVRKFSVSRSEREHRAYICSFLLLRWNDYMVARRLGVPYYGTERGISRRWKSLRQNWREHKTLMDKDINLRRANALYADSQLRILTASSMHTYFQNNAKSLLWINLDDRYTWGRYVLDAAALGIPILTTVSTGHGELLFPQTTVPTAFDVDKAIAIGQQLIEDADFYQSVSTYAQENMQAYTTSAMKKKLLSALGES